MAEETLEQWRDLALRLLDDLAKATEDVKKTTDMLRSATTSQQETYDLLMTVISQRDRLKIIVEQQFKIMEDAGLNPEKPAEWVQ